MIIAVYGFAVLLGTVPIHWGFNGQANGYGSKWVGTFLLPAISIGIYVLVRMLLVAGPSLEGREHTAANIQIGKILLAAIMLYLLIIQLSTIAKALGADFDITMVIMLALSVLYIFAGNYMGKIRRNFWIGIRTPWALANAVVWERTHRLGGWLFVAVGLIGIPCSFLPALRLWGILVPLIAVLISLYIYSYVSYQRVTREPGEALSPPFETDRE